MQNKKVNKAEYALISIPIEVLEEANVFEGDILQFSAVDGKVIIENLDDLCDFICDGDCESCPLGEIDCDGDCENCPRADDCDESEVH